MASRTGSSSMLGPYLFCAGLGGAGLLLLWTAADNVRGGRWTQDAKLLGALGGAMLLGALAAGAGLRRLAAKQAEADALVTLHPDQPWKWKPEWDGRPIEAGDRKGAGVLVLFAVVWNAISWPVFLMVWWGPKDNPLPVKLLVTLFPLIGVLVAWGAAYKLIQSRKFGRPRFVPSTVPGVIGGYVGGVIEVPARVTPEGDATLALRNLRLETRGSGKNRSTKEITLWEREERIAPEKWVSGPGRTDVPVLFHVPDTCSATDDSDPDNEIVWRLETKAAVAGVDFRAMFTLPVFATGETAPPPEGNAPLLAEYKAGPPDAETLRRAGVLCEGDGFTFHSRHLRTGRMVTTGITLGLLAVTGILVGTGAPFGAVAAALFFTVLAGALASDFWTDRFEVGIAGAEVVVTNRRPWGVKVTRLPRAEVVEVRARMTMQAGETKYHRLTLVGRAGMDPAKPGQGENFAARKLRFQLQRRAKELGVQDAGKLGEAGAEIRLEMGRTPRFEVAIAKHVPGQATAERVAAMVLQKIRGS